MRLWSRCLAAGLAGGSLGATCHSRFRDAIVDGSKQFVFNNLLNPSVFLDFSAPKTANDAFGD